MNLGEHLYTSPLQRYARDFLQAVLDYAAALNDEELLASLKATLCGSRLSSVQDSRAFSRWLAYSRSPSEK